MLSIENELNRTTLHQIGNCGFHCPAICRNGEYSSAECLPIFDVSLLDCIRANPLYGNNRVADLPFGRKSSTRFPSAKLMSIIY